MQSSSKDRSDCRGNSSGGSGGGSSGQDVRQRFKRQRLEPGLRGCPLTNGGDHGPCSLCSCSNHVVPSFSVNPCPCPHSKAPNYKVYANSNVANDWRHTRNQEDLDRCNLLRDRMTAPDDSQAQFEQMQRLYRVQPITVTNLSCICRSCFDHDISPAECPDLPRYYKMILNGHKQVQNTDEEKCHVCAHLVKEYEMTNSTDPAPAYSIGHAATPKQVTLFFAAAYGVTYEFVPGDVKQLCSTHYDHFMKRLPTRDGALASKMRQGATSTYDAFIQSTDAVWVGWHYRECISCGESKDRSTADAWRLVGEEGAETHQHLQEWMSHTVAGAPECAVELVTEYDHVSAVLTATDVPIGSCEWLCKSCWQVGTHYTLFD